MASGDYATAAEKTGYMVGRPVNGKRRKGP